MNLKRTATRSTEEVASDLSQLVEEGRALLGDILNQPQERVAHMRAIYDDMGEKLAGFQSSATRAAQQRVKQGARYARKADKYLHDNPWPTVAGAIILGVLATLWWGQRR